MRYSNDANSPLAAFAYLIRNIRIMYEDRKLLVRATATMVGMIIGAGIFGVPYAFVRAGVIPGILTTLGVAVIFTVYHLLYGEVVLRTRSSHRLVGFAELYLGPWAKRLVTITSVLGFYGAILAYIVLGGAFLHALIAPFVPIDLFTTQVMFFAAIAVAIFLGLRIVSRIETALTFLLVVTVLGILAMIVPRADADVLQRTFSGVEFLLPYGVILFALGGASAVPEMRDMLIGKEKLFRPAIVWGTAIASALTLAFGTLVVAVSGRATSEEALLGLFSYVGPWVVVVGACMGLLAIATSFLVIGLNLRELFELDYRMGRLPAVALALGVPFGAFLLGAQSFIFIISITGAVFVGVDTIIIGMLAIVAKEQGKRKPEYRVNVPAWAIFLISLAFFIGMVAELSRFI